MPTGAFFAGASAIAVFDKTWKGPAISYIGRDELEACGEAFLAQVRQQAEKLVMAA
ncbi:DNA adenine methylase [Escherichia coli]|nr:DNA adenine methylase [Escherichia coli]